MKTTSRLADSAGSGMRRSMPPDPEWSLPATDKELRRAVTERLGAMDRSVGRWELLRIFPHSALIAGAWMLLARAEDHLSVGFVLLAVVVGHSYACLAFLAHDVAHGGVVRGTRARYAMELLLWAPLLLPPTLWRVLHNRTHHVHANTPDDCDRAYLQEDGSLAAKRLYMKLFSPLRGSLGLANPLYLLHFPTYVTRNILSLGLGVNLPIVAARPRIRSPERVAILLELVAMGLAHALVLGALWRGVETLVIMELIPIVTASSVLMAFIFTNHLSRPVLRSSDILATTVSLRLPRVLSVLYSRFDHHVEHHLFPGLPSALYPRVRAALLDVTQREHAMTFSAAWREVLQSPFLRPPCEPLETLSESEAGRQ